MVSDSSDDEPGEESSGGKPEKGEQEERSKTKKDKKQKAKKAGSAASSSSGSLSLLKAILKKQKEKLEQEQLEKKHWSVSGEATAHNRPLNSLLELHVDLPMSHFAGKKAIDAAIAGGYDGMDGDDEGADAAPIDGGANSALFGKSKGVKGADLEKIILARIKEQLFDDVIAQTEAPPAQKADTGEADDGELVEFTATSPC